MDKILKKWNIAVLPLSEVTSTVSQWKLRIHTPNAVRILDALVTRCIQGCTRVVSSAQERAISPKMIGNTEHWQIQMTETKIKTQNPFGPKHYRLQLPLQELTPNLRPNHPDQVVCQREPNNEWKRRRRSTFKPPIFPCSHDKPWTSTTTEDGMRSWAGLEGEGALLEEQLICRRVPKYLWEL